jgi:hypothetical protein
MDGVEVDDMGDFASLSSARVYMLEVEKLEIFRPATLHTFEKGDSIANVIMIS